MNGAAADPAAGPVPWPKLAAGVLVHPPLDEMPAHHPAAGAWVVQRADHTYLRVTEHLGSLMVRLDGTADPDRLVADLGGSWTPELVDQALAMLAEKEVLDDGTSVPARTRARFRFSGSHRIQFDLVEPRRLLERVWPLIRTLMTRPARITGVALLVIGLAALVLDPAAAATFTRPLPWWAFIVVGVALLLIAAIHELAHAATLMHHRGNPGRIGVMLYYFSPAVYCDVTDGWRLPRPSQRVEVALAGIWVQTVIGAVLAIVGAVAGRAGAPDAVHDTLVLIAVSSMVTGVLNLLPLIKLDGYLALMSYVDRPHLRENAMADARSWAAHVFLGSTRQQRLADVSWAVPYGLASMGMPLYVVGTVLFVALDLVMGFGVAALGAVLLVGLGVVAFVVRGWYRLVTEARRDGAHLLRVAVVTALVLAAVVASGFGVRVQDTTSGGYVAADGRVDLVLLDDRNEFRVGTEVELRRAGLLGSVLVGHAEVADAEPIEVVAPISAFLPITDAAWAEMPVTGYALSTRDVVPDGSGATRVIGETSSFWQWLGARYVTPLLNH